MQRKKLSLVSSAVFLTLLLLGLSIRVDLAVLSGQSGAIPKLTGPVLKSFRTIAGVKGFDDFKIHPDRYVLTSGIERPWPPVIYDVMDNKKVLLPPIEKMSGLPVPPEISPGEGYSNRLRELKLADKYWKWYVKRIVAYYPEKGSAGIMLTKYLVKRIPGEPRCQQCNGAAKFIPKYQRYYCHSCRKYVPEEVYLKDRYESYFAHMDTASKKVTWIAPLEMNMSNPMEQQGIEPIGIDFKQGHFYYSNRIFLYKRKKTSGQILLYRFNINDQRVDWRYRIKVPVRFKGKTAGAYSIQAFTSEDMSKIVFWEYDEALGPGNSKGWLNGPTARGYIVDTGSRSYKEIAVPMTPYGQLIDHSGSYLLLGSNQTGMVHRYDLASGREERKFNSGKTIYFIALSAGSKYLYVLNRNNVLVYDWPTLSLAKRLPVSSVFPGVTRLLVKEKALSMAMGRYIVIGVFKKTGSGAYFTSDDSRGFQLLAVGD